MNKSWFLFLPLLFIVACSNSQRAQTSKASKDSDAAIQSEAGLKIPKWGIVIDAYYMPKLDSMIPGYRVLNILIQNNNPEDILLHPKHDKWVITDHLGEQHKALNHIKYFNAKLWDKMSPRAKNLLDYPHKIHPGEVVTIDVYFKDNVELRNFREIAWHSDFFDKEFNIMTAYEDHINVKYKVIDNENKIKSDTDTQAASDEEKAYQQARDKFIGNHEKDVKKVFYVTPQGKIEEK